MPAFHSVTLDSNKCKGCINCVKRCPTEAIRVKNGKAFIINDRCIDCGECIRICPNRAKKAVHDKLSDIENYEYTVALPAPSLYAQFNNLENIDYILEGFKLIGFDDVFEVAGAAEIASEITRDMMRRDDILRPVITNACPAVVRLVKVRFPKLIPHLNTVLPPVDIAAKIARKRAQNKTGLAPEKIGVFFISPCPAKVTALHHPIGEPITVDGVLSMTEVYKALLPAMKKVEDVTMEQISGLTGMSWSYTGGEATSLLVPRYLAADGIENVIKVLEEIEDDKLKDIDFVELNACVSGCVGGCLNIENPFISITKVRKLRKYRPVSATRLSDHGDFEKTDFILEGNIEYDPSMRLADDTATAMEIMLQIDAIESELPGIDCAACGSPSCACFAQDVAMDKAKISDCVFVMKREMQKMLSQKGDQNDDKGTV